MSDPLSLLGDPIPLTREEVRTRLSDPDAFEAEVEGVEGYLLAGKTYDVDPSNRRWKDGRRFFADAFHSISAIRADGLHPGRVDRIQAVIANFFTPGIGFIACLVSARDYLRALWDDQDAIEGPLVIGIHDFHYGAGNADWSGELGRCRLPWPEPSEPVCVWRGDEEKGFAAVYGQDLVAFAASMERPVDRAGS